MLSAMIDPMISELGLSPTLLVGAILVLLLAIGRRSGGRGQRTSD
jgi:hypothetical protein